MLTFPTHLFNPARITMRPGGATLAGGESLAGETDIIKTDGGGYWILDMLGVELNSPDLIRAWRAWQDHLAEGVTKVLVPVADIRQSPRPIAGNGLARPSRLLPQSTDPYFPEALGFASPFIVAKITAAAALRATQLTILVERGARLRGGEVFAVTHPDKGRRCYRVGRVLARDGQEATVTIRSPLRQAVTIDTAADFDWPSFVARLVPDADISPELEYGRAGVVDISFREAF